MKRRRNPKLDWLSNQTHRSYSQTQLFVAETGDEFEFSWTAIQRAVNDGNILKA